MDRIIPPILIENIEFTEEERYGDDYQEDRESDILRIDEYKDCSNDEEEESSQFVLEVLHIRFLL